MQDPGRGSLVSHAYAVLAARDTSVKVALAQQAAGMWQARQLSVGLRGDAIGQPTRPGRPDAPVLLAPRYMPKRSLKGERGRFALLHSLAHIELNAIDLTWDLIGRFAHLPLPRSFLDDWVRVGFEEAKHFQLLDCRLQEMGGHYGDLPAHDGLWEAAEETGHCLRARIAIIPLVLEARGLDVAPPMIEKAEAAGDTEAAKILTTIYTDELRHVAFGAKWFRYLCAEAGIKPEPEFHRLVRKHFRGGLKPPFNDKARSEAGLSPGFYKPLVAIGRFN